jgi:hypothetical protein
LFGDHSLSNTLDGALSESNASSIQIQNIRIIDNFVNGTTDAFDEILDTIDRRDRQINKTGTIEDSVKIEIETEDEPVDIWKQFESLGDLTSGVTDQPGILNVWFDGVARGLMRTGGYLMYVWMDSSSEQRIAVTSAAAAMTSFVVGRNAIGATPMATLSSVQSNGYLVVDTAYSTTREFSSFVISSAKSSAWHTLELSMKHPKSTIALSMFGGGMAVAYIDRDRVLPVASDIVLGGAKLANETIHLAYTGARIGNAALTTNEDRIIQVSTEIVDTVDALTGSAKHTAQTIEHVVESINDAVAETKQTIGSASFGYVAVALLGVLASTYVGMEGNKKPRKRMKK